MQRFQGKNILITGAGSGIGRAAAIRLASEGSSLALLDINLTSLESLVHELKQYPVRVIYDACDVSDFDQTKKIIDEMCSELGGINGLNHNAGILRCYHTHEMTLAEWNEILNVNLTGTFNINRHSLPHLLKNPVSFIVNTSSTASEHPHPWLAAYSASKGAIKSFTRSLFIEYCLQGLRANCILPGSIQTQLGNAFQLPPGANPQLIKFLNPLGKSNVVDPAQAAGVIAMLLSDDALHINGTEISIDGGKIG
jgi:NAD(P)-dependent dehydrogenase (short-subunit alcohol dehydrogenase family)